MARRTERGHRCGRWLAAALCTAVLAAQVPAFAQSDDENARLHFESGAAYFKESDYDGALREFTAAYGLSKRPELLLNIASVYERMGKLEQTIDALEKYLKAKPDAQDKTTIETRIANLKKRLASEPPPAPAPSATATATAAPAASAVPTPPPAKEDAPSRAPAYIALGVGGAAAIGAVVTGLVAKSKYDDADGSCKPSCGDSTVRSIESMALVSDVLTGVAIVGVGVGTVLLLTGGHSREQASAVPRVDAGVGAHGGGVEATWRF